MAFRAGARAAAPAGRGAVRAPAAMKGGQRSIGLMGNKVGMSAIFDEATGAQTACTLIGFTEGDNYVTEVRTEKTHGYNGVQIGYGAVPERKLSLAELGHCSKAGTPPLRHLKEWRVPYDLETRSLTAGMKLDPTKLFTEGEKVDVTGTSIGKGFQGNIKRHGFKRGLMTHGSKSHREHGSTGPGATPSRVYPGVKHPGRMGNEKVTIKKMEVVKVTDEYIAVKGSIPGKPGNLVSISKAKKGYRPS